MRRTDTDLADVHRFDEFWNGSINDVTSALELLAGAKSGAPCCYIAGLNNFRTVVRKSQVGPLPLTISHPISNSPRDRHALWGRLFAFE
ncbi:MAG: hypothetical protein RLP98_13595 [Devosia sp.]